MGFTGQISLGHGAFIGVGAYAAGILATRLSFPFYFTLPAAGLITALVGVLFGLPSLRLKHLYLTIATLAGQFIIEYTLVHWESLTQGTMGIIMPSIVLFKYEVVSGVSFYILIYLILAVMTWMASNILRTKFGRAFMAVRDNDMAAIGMGINLFEYKLLAFAISAFYTGIAGCLWAYYMMSITSEPFTLSLSIHIIAMVIIGGMGSIPGSIFGAIFITALNETAGFATEALMNIGANTSLALTIAPLKEITFGVAIVLFILFEPRGLAELWRILRSRFRLWPFPY
jgi:branched-chain amino acid transport system permease protein